MYAPFKDISDHVTCLPATVLCTCFPHLQNKRTEYQQVSWRKKGACSQLKLSGQAESVQSGVSDVFMGLGLHRAQVLGELGKPTGSSSSRNTGSDKEKQRPLYVLNDVAKSVPTQQVISQNGLIVTNISQNRPSVTSWWNHFHFQ